MKQQNMPPSLRKNILSGIRTYEYQQARRFLLVSLTTGLMSLVGIIISVWYLVASLYQTSFYYYLTLIFTDADLIFPYWREFVLSLAETLPLFGITLLLTGTVTFLVSLRIFIQNVRHDFSLSFST